MLKSYLLVAYRNLRRSWSYTAINVAGLAVGVACCLLMTLYVQDELSYDRHFDDAESIVRVVTAAENSQGVRNVAASPTAWGYTLAQEHPKVQAHTVFYPSSVLLSRGAAHFEETTVQVYGSFFDVFGVDLLRGNAETALSSPTSVVLSERAARKYFGDDNPLGKVITINSKQDAEVTGVMETLPGNTHFQADVLLPMHDMVADQIPAVWDRIYTRYTYLRLDDPASAAAVEAALPALVRRHVEPSVAARYSPSLQAVTDIHLYSDRVGEIAPGGNVSYVYLFGLVAVLVLVIACVNYMNLATARSAQRAKEVGMRKVLGAHRGQLIFQFLGESVLISLAATASALLLAAAAMPFFNGLSGKSLSVLDLLTDPVLLLLTVGGSALVGVLAGTYPALYLSGFSPSRVLQGAGGTTTGGGGLLRRALVISQFAAGVALIITTAIVYQQLTFMQTKNLGFDKENVVVLPIRSDLMYEIGSSVTNDFKQSAYVRGVAATSAMPGELLSSRQFRRADDETKHDFKTVSVDDDYLDVLGVTLAAGRWFDGAAYASDSTAYVLNASAVRDLGWTPDEALGKSLSSLYDDGKLYYRGPVIGVVEDAHFASLHDAIHPMAFVLRPWPLNRVAVRVAPGDLATSLTAVRSVWRKWMPNRPFNYTFLDDDLDSLYRAEQRTAKIFAAFAGLTIFVACLGLIGLASFSAQQRRREVGVRRAMGATASQIVTLLSADSLKLVVLGIVIASPVAYYLMTRWLEDFAFRIDVGPGPFVAAGVGAIVIAGLTVGAQALRAALQDPTTALRSE